MRAICHNKKFSKKAGVPQDVGCEFVKADKKESRNTFEAELIEAILEILKK